MAKYEWIRWNDWADTPQKIYAQLQERRLTDDERSMLGRNAKRKREKTSAYRSKKRQQNNPLHIPTLPEMIAEHRLKIEAQVEDWNLAVELWTRHVGQLIERHKSQREWIRSVTIWRKSLTDFEQRRARSMHAEKDNDGDDGDDGAENDDDDGRRVLGVMSLEHYDARCAEYLYVYNWFAELQQRSPEELKMVMSEDELRDRGALVNRNLRKLTAEWNSEFRGKEPPIEVPMVDECVRCRSRLELLTNGSLMVCPKCRTLHKHEDTTMATLAFKQEVELTTQHHQKIQHLKDKIKKAQSQTGKRTDEDAVLQIMEWIHERHALDPKDMIADPVGMQRKIEEAIVELKLDPSLKKHVVQIYSMMLGIKPLIFSNEQDIEVLIIFFNIIENGLYNRWKALYAPNRVNCINYPFYIRKVCRMMGWNIRSVFFNQLKGDPKRRRQELIWRGVCHEVAWPNVPPPPPSETKKK